MPMTFRIDGETGMVLSQAVGVFAPEELLRTVVEALSDPSRRAPYRALCDLRQVERFEGANEKFGAAVRLIVEHHSKELEGARVAFLAPEDYVFGMGKVLGAYADMLGVEVRPFRNSEEAETWLNRATSS